METILAILGAVSAIVVAILRYKQDEKEASIVRALERAIAQQAVLKVEADHAKNLANAGISKSDILGRMRDNLRERDAAGRD